MPVSLLANTGLNIHLTHTSHRMTYWIIKIHEMHHRPWGAFCLAVGVEEMHQQPEHKVSVFRV